MPVKVGEKVEIDTTAPAADVDAKLSKALTQALDNGSQHVEITLSPANLGTVTAEFTRTPEGALHLVLRAENEHAAKLLSEHANTLGLMLQDSTRGEVRVEVPQPHQGQQPWQQPDQNGGQQQQQPVGAAATGVLAHEWLRWRAGGDHRNGGGGDGIAPQRSTRPWPSSFGRGQSRALVCGIGSRPGGRE